MSDRLPITGRTGLTGLLGSPVAHSLSPLMHNEAFSILGLHYVYLCFDVGEEKLEEAVKGLKACKIRGFNLTMPNKTRMYDLADELSPAAKLIGAVNTVVNENGRLIGHNTDGVGFMRSVACAGYDILGKEITVMGGGGAATALIAQAALDGVKKINIFTRPTSRFHERTLRLADTVNGTTSCRASLFDMADQTQLRASLKDSVLLVNATSLGMAPGVDATPVPDISLFYPELIVSDIIYNPKETRFLQEARAAGCRIFNGLYMLLYQGAEAFHLWTGQEMPVDVIKEKYFK